MGPLEAFCEACRQNKRILELENIIKRDPMLSSLYAEEIIKGRWLEAEQNILNSNPNAINHYLHCNKELQPTRSKEVPLKLGKFIIYDIPNTITDEQIDQLFISLFEMSSYNIHKGHTYHNMSKYREYNEQIINKQLLICEHIAIKQLPTYKFMDFFCIEYDVYENDFS